MTDYGLISCYPFNFKRIIFAFVLTALYMSFIACNFASGQASQSLSEKARLAMVLRQKGLPELSNYLYADSANTKRIAADLITSNFARLQFAHNKGAGHGPTLVALRKATLVADPTTKLHTIRAIGAIRDSSTETLSLLIKELQNQEPYVAYQAAHSLGKLGYRAVPAEPALIDLLKNQSWIFGEARAESAKTLGIMQQQHSIPHLVSALKTDSYWKVRKQAAIALGRYKKVAKSAVPALIQQLRYRRHWQVRHYSAIALSKIGDRRAIPALKNMAKRERLRVKVCKRSGTNCKYKYLRDSALIALSKLRAR